MLIDGMRALGFRTLLPDALQAPIIVTFHMPADPNFVFQRFYDGLKDRGYVIYPGKLTVADSFRIGCIGRLYPKDMRGALAAVREVLDEMGVDLPRRRRRHKEEIADEHAHHHGARGRRSTAAATGSPRRRRSRSASTARSRAISRRAIEQGLAPNFARLMRTGANLRALSVIPSFTNPNNLSIITGAPPAVHGIAGNYFYDRGDRRGSDDERCRVSCAPPTIMQAFHDAGAKVAVVTAKDKLRTLLGNGLDMSTRPRHRLLVREGRQGEPARERHRRRARRSSACRCRRSTPRTCPSSCSPPASRSWSATGPT